MAISLAEVSVPPLPVLQILVLHPEDSCPPPSYPHHVSLHQSAPYLPSLYPKQPKVPSTISITACSRRTTVAASASGPSKHTNRRHEHKMASHSTRSFYDVLEGSKGGGDNRIRQLPPGAERAEIHPMFTSLIPSISLEGWERSQRRLHGSQRLSP